MEMGRAGGGCRQDGGISEDSRVSRHHKSQDRLHAHGLGCKLSSGRQAGNATTHPALGLAKRQWPVLRAVHGLEYLCRLQWEHLLQVPLLKQRGL